MELLIDKLKKYEVMSMGKGEEALSTTLILKKPVIAITGSAGKTTTKEMLAAILMQRWKILKTSGNANAPRHTAMYRGKISPSHKAIVLEYGMSHHGQIKRSCLIIQPNIGIVTNVGTAHVGNFKGDIKGVANTKSDLIRYMKSTGLLLLNADDENSKLLDTKKFKGKIIYVSQKGNADYIAEQIKYTSRGMSFFTKIDNQKYQFTIPIFGAHNVYNALFAIATAYHLGFKPEEIQKGLRLYKRPSRRLTIYRLKNGITLIDDTFSANPNAVKAAIDVMTNISNGQKIAVLGTMLEMGSYTVKGHMEIGRYLADKNIDKLYTYGKLAKYIGQGAIEAGYPKEKVVNYLDQLKLIRALLREVKPNTTVLLKASHGMNLNYSVKALAEYSPKKIENK